jgi:2Fe-2S ferredoxin
MLQDFEIKVLCAGDEYILQVHKNEYRSLMVLLKDKISPDDFGQCGGMGRCGTCLVRIFKPAGDSLLSFRNEQVTLKKMGISDPGIRLSCNIQADDDLRNVIVELLDNI